jgi:iron complex transport system ATP-binding protein
VSLARYPHRRAFQLGPDSDDVLAVRKALDQVDLAALAHRPMEKLSGGERQAAHLAAALAQESELLVLDEPTTHLDPGHQRHVARLLVKLNRELGRTVVVATHELNFAVAVASRLVGLQEGRILAEGDISELARPEVLEALFAAPFRVVADGDRPQVLLRMAP